MLIKGRTTVAAGATVVVTIGVAWLCVFAWYVASVIGPEPRLDDWNAVHTLQRYLEGGLSLGAYLLAPHNEHLSLPSRLLFLLSYKLTDLRLTGVFVTTALVLCLAGFVAFRMLRSIGKTNRPTLAQRMFCFLPVLPMTVSLGHWEILSMASCVSNAFVLLFSLLALLAMGRWGRDEGTGHLAVAVVAALLASGSMAHGVMTWFALAGQAFALRRPRVRLALLFAAIGVGAVALLAGSGIANAASKPLSLEGLVQAALTLAGASVFGFVENRPVPEVALAFGTVIAALAACAALALTRARPEERERSIESVGLLVLGALGIAAVSFGRLEEFGPEYMASARYAAIALPFTLGVYYFWLSWPRRGAHVLAAVVAGVILAGQAVTNVQEMRMAPHRAVYSRETIRLLCTTPADDLALSVRNSSASSETIATVRRFLAQHRLSVFSDPRICAAAG